MKRIIHSCIVFGKTKGARLTFSLSKSYPKLLICFRFIFRQCFLFRSFPKFYIEIVDKTMPLIRQFLKS